MVNVITYHAGVGVNTFYQNELQVVEMIIVVSGMQ